MSETEALRAALARIDTYIRAYHDAPTWGGPTIWPAAPKVVDIEMLANAARSALATRAPDHGEISDGLAYVKETLRLLFEKRGKLRDGVLASRINMASHRLAQVQKFLSVETTPAPDRPAEERAREVLANACTNPNAKEALKDANRLWTWSIKATDAFRAMLAFASEREAAAGRAEAWQPIETAPRDGTELDLWSDAGRLPECKWIDRDPNGPGWFSRGESGWVSLGAILIQPTHWMPLPTPPATAIRGSDDA